MSDDGRFLMPMNPKTDQFRPTHSIKAEFDKSLPSASPGLHRREPSIPLRASPTRPELGMVSPELSSPGLHRREPSIPLRTFANPARVRYGVPRTRPELGMVSPELRARTLRQFCMISSEPVCYQPLVGRLGLSRRVDLIHNARDHPTPRIRPGRRPPRRRSIAAARLR